MYPDSTLSTVPEKYHGTLESKILKSKIVRELLENLQESRERKLLKAHSYQWRERVQGSKYHSLLTTLRTLSLTQSLSLPYSLPPLS